MISRVVWLLLLALFAAACQRPFAETDRPRLIVLDPDLSIIQTERQMTLSVRLSSSASIETVLAGEDTLRFEPSENAWIGQHVLSNGLNEIILTATDEDLRSTRDTLYAFVNVLTAARTTPSLPDPLGAHTATPMQDGTILVTGGAPRVGADAVDSAYLLDDAQTGFLQLGAKLNTARAGHTATLLPSGHVLLLGGSTRETVTDILDLVETVEFFDPTTQTFVVGTVEGPPIRRAYHTATLHREGGDVFVDLYGGIGDDNYTPPVLGRRADVRRFRVDGTTLTALDPAPGPRLDERAVGHSQTDLYPGALEDPLFYVAGTEFADGEERIVSFELAYRRNVGLLDHRVADLQLSRTQHAAVLLEDGFVGLFGGRKAARTSAQVLPEIYASRARRTFLYGESGPLLARYAHTATKVRNRRILLLGGFASDGEGVVTSELYQVPAF